MWAASSGNSTINGKITYNGKDTTGISVRNQKPPKEVAFTQDGFYSLTIANQTAPFKIEYGFLKPLVLTVTRSGGGSATIDVAFDDTTIIEGDSLKQPVQKN